MAVRCKAGTAAALVLGLVLVSRESAAASLTWSAPPACPTQEQVNERVTRDVGADLGTLPDLAFDAKVGLGARGYELKLTVRKDETVHERRISAKTCDELVDALGAAVALAIHSLSPPVAESPPQEPPEPAEPPPPPEAPPAPKPSLPRPRSAAPLPPAPPRPRIYPSVALGGLFDARTFPDPAFGVEGSLGLRVAWFVARAYGLALPKQRSKVLRTAQADFDLLAGGVGVGGSYRGPWWELRGFLAGEAGRLQGRGVNVENPQTANVPWIALVPEAAVLARPPRQGWGGFLSLGAVVPLNREAFVLTREGSIHRPAAVGLRLGLGIELEFR